MISSKSQIDSPFSNETWRSVGKAIENLSIHSVNRIERELLDYVRWEVVIRQQDIEMVKVSSSNAV